MRNALLALLVPPLMAGGVLRVYAQPGGKAPASTGTAPASTASPASTATAPTSTAPPANTAAAPAKTATAPAAASASAGSAAEFDMARLEQIVAPIALYPDVLLTQVLMSSTYPLEIVEADRWLTKNPGLKGDALDAALKEQDWDPSIKALCRFPDVVKRMSDNISWTKDLGDAFLAQQSELMDTVQRMRGKAFEAGNLKTNEQQVVTQKADKIIVIESTSPEVIYVPTYSPTVVYGPAWYYPTWYYPPMYYYPPGAAFFTFSVGVAFGAAMWGNCNWGWGGGNVYVDHHTYNNFNRNTNINGGDRNTINGGDRNNIGGGDRNTINSGDRNQVSTRDGDRSTWNHDPSHRQGVNYRDSKTAQQFGGSGNSRAVTRDQARGYSPASAGSRDLSGGGAGVGTRDLSTGGAGTRDLSTGSAGTRDLSTGNAGSRDLSGSRDSSAARSSSMDRSASSRGSSSRGTASYGGSRGGGGRSGGGGGRRR